MSGMIDILEGYQAYQEGKAQKKAYDANAEILRQNAAKKRMETSLNEDIMRSKNRRDVSKARAAFAEVGMATSATTSGVLGQMTTEQENEVLVKRYQGETEAVNYMNQANLQNYYGRKAKRRGLNTFKMSFLKVAAKAIAAAGGAAAASGGGGTYMDVTGTAGTGGNVTFTNASYMG